MINHCDRHITYIHTYSTVKRHTMINHCDRRITYLGDMDISIVLFNISSEFLLYLECYLLTPKNAQESK